MKKNENQVKLSVRVYADNLLLKETDDERVIAAVMDWIVFHRGSPTRDRDNADG